MFGQIIKDMRCYDIMVRTKYNIFLDVMLQMIIRKLYLGVPSLQFCVKTTSEGTECCSTLVKWNDGITSQHRSLSHSC